MRYWGNIYWPIWLGITTLTLGIPEIYALATDAHNTLSDWVWRGLQVTKEQQLPWTAAHFLVFGGWIVVTLWLTWHFFFRRFT